MPFVLNQPRTASAAVLAPEAAHQVIDKFSIYAP